MQQQLKLGCIKKMTIKSDYNTAYVGIITHSTKETKTCIHAAINFSFHAFCSMHRSGMVVLPIGHRTSDL